MLHPIECRSGVKPVDLLLVEGVRQLDLIARAIRVLEDSSQGLKEGQSNVYY